MATHNRENKRKTFSQFFSGDAIPWSCEEKERVHNVSTKSCQDVVIGAGPGGYVAAIRLAQAGRQVVLVEAKELGGACLNVGCIPTKALLKNAEMVRSMKKAEIFGIHVDKFSLNFAKMQQRKATVVSDIKNGLRTLLEKNHIEIMQGFARFTTPHALNIEGANLSLSFENAIIATGSQPRDIPSIPCDHKNILNSTSILEIPCIPKSLAIVGGGYIGCEFASLFESLGSQVTIVEAAPRILSTQDEHISAFMQEHLTQLGIHIETNTQILKIENAGTTPTLHLSSPNHQEKTTQSYEKVLIATGRSINTQPLHLEKAGVLTGPRQEIIVTDNMRTTVPHIYAIGDVTGLYMLAHVASHQGMVAAENIQGIPAKMRYNAVPSVVFTYPEFAAVGITQKEANKQEHSINIGKFPFQALGKAVASHDTEGFLEIFSDKQTNQVLGGQVIGSGASILIAQIALAVANELTLECLIHTIHAHPTLAEGWLEAALAAYGTPLHLPPNKKRSLSAL